MAMSLDDRTPDQAYFDLPPLRAAGGSTYRRGILFRDQFTRRPVAFFQHDQMREGFWTLPFSKLKHWRRKAAQRARDGAMRQNGRG
jgi:hypothetical protein